MKKVSIIAFGLIILFAPLVSLAQNARDLLHDFRRVIREPDSTGGEVTDAKAFTWLNMGLREFSDWGVFMKETTYVLADGRDSVQLPVDFLWPKYVRKTIPSRGNDLFLTPLDSQPSLYPRLDTVVLSTVRPDTLLAKDIFAVQYCYKKAATEKAIRPLIQLSPDSLEAVGRALASRQLSAEYLSERLDTLIPSTTQPINLLRTDVFEVRAAYRKKIGEGTLVPLIRIPAESLSRVANTASDYYYYSGQPAPRIVFGQKKTFADTVYVEVLVASDFYTLISQPYPRLIMGKIPTSADTCFCYALASVPQYTVHDTARRVAGVSYDSRSINWMVLQPPPVRADTLKVNYFAQLDTLSTPSDSTSGLVNLQFNVRTALIFYMAELFYSGKQMDNKVAEYGGRWRAVLARYGIQRGNPIAIPSSQ